MYRLHEFRDKVLQKKLFSPSFCNILKVNDCLNDVLRCPTDTSKLQYAQMINGIAMVTDFIVFRRPTSRVFNENRAIPLARKITIVIKQDFNHVPLIY